MTSCAKTVIDQSKPIYVIYSEQLDDPFWPDLHSSVRSSRVIELCRITNIILVSLFSLVKKGHWAVQN